ncbi:hypothetical protein DVH24_018875 [Malus domestica]|uniref:Large ribosomal RNA subunit accumulation protein YCED homolog 2, chloroplastic n=1 Tax=Malus domestica TaxID=3750 RepID=A0A498HLD1_MALDO|nr:hypothetical protein DVH24_018875 [Malus domestica]
MEEVGHLLSARHIKLLSVTPANPKFSASVSRSFTIRASSKRNSLSLGNKKNSRSSSPRSVIRLSTADGKWHGNWSCDYILSLQDLRLDDLIEDENTHDAQISVNLCVHKHASFGFSVDGRILTSFNRKCSNCSSTYCRKIDTQFNVWVLSSSRDEHTVQLPEIGGDDPSLKQVDNSSSINTGIVIQRDIPVTAFTKPPCHKACLVYEIVETRKPSKESVSTSTSTLFISSTTDWEPLSKYRKPKKSVNSSGLRDFKSNS